MASSTTMAETISWYTALFMAAMLILSSCEVSESESAEVDDIVAGGRRMNMAERRPCDEIYEVREGETLQSISEKCGDPFIIEANPHIHDPDDVFPGLLIKITPFNPH
ncbi:uncharacterized protein LOC110822861 [Carica papaya]|uniref:uncharacterized protein LOC110822861 n=1 Tax=Carica papaya TaxID=3649 RepID=UPI000B8C892E|nr:uncharacterized protein LOC110822861 [Carica papaya]